MIKTPKKQQNLYDEVKNCPIIDHNIDPGAFICVLIFQKQGPVLKFKKKHFFC
jgi:hypothetical protein